MSETSQSGGSHILAARLLNSAALIACVLGVGLALYALAAPIGVWLGQWDFRRGFELLRNAEPYAMWIAGFGLAAGIGGLLGALALKWGNSLKLTGLALVAAVVAFTAQAVPNSYRVPVPPIHDVATDTDNPLPYVAIAPLRADAPNTMDYGASSRMTPAEHAIEQKNAYPDIVPQRFSESPEVIFERAVEAVERLGWELVAGVPEEGRIEATDTTFWFRFKDDVVIRIERDGQGTLLNARSLSRVGGSDFGKNAGRLRELFALL